MKTNKQLLQVAIRQLGKGGAKFRAYVGLGSGQPWCDAFVYWLYNANGCGKLLPWNGKQRYYCPDSIKWADKNLALLPPYLALPCDLIYFDWEPNGVPNHIGIVEAKVSTSKIRTIEGNTDGGKVARKTRPSKYIEGIYRPHFPGSYKLKRIKEDGDFGYTSIANLRKALGMTPSGILSKEAVKYLQRRAGATADGVWATGTSRKVQKMIGAKVDGEFGPSSVRKLQAWINKVNYGAVKKNASEAKPGLQKSSGSTKKKTAAKKPAAKPAEQKKAAPAKKTPAKKPAAKVTNQQKLLSKAKELAWAYGTPKSKYAYKTGAPKAVCKKAMKKYGWADNKAEMSDCGNFVSTIVRETGINKTFKAQHGVKTPFPKTEKGFNMVLQGKAIPKGFLKPGDIVRYKKKNGRQHTLMYFGDSKVCEASIKHRFGAIVKDAKRYDTKAKKDTIQVLRAKE